MAVPTFENWLSDRIVEYNSMLMDAKDPEAEAKLQRALLHVSTLNFGAHAYDAVKAFFQRREDFPKVKLIVAEDNEAVIKVLAKGRSPKLRHVARTHRVNLDWCYDFSGTRRSSPGMLLHWSPGRRSWHDGDHEE